MSNLMPIKVAKHKVKATSSLIPLATLLMVKQTWQRHEYQILQTEHIAKFDSLTCTKLGLN